jgi:hypothetical protein
VIVIDLWTDRAPVDAIRCLIMSRCVENPQSTARSV